MTFCPKCGKPSKGFCKGCKPKVVKKLSTINLEICAGCGKVKQHTWSKFKDADTGIRSIIKKKTKEEVEYEIPEHKKNPGIRLKIEYSGDIVKGEVSILYSLCTECKKKTGDYYEGWLMIRNPNKDIMDFLKKYVNTRYKVKSPNGFDVKVIDKKKAMTLGRKLQQQFGGILKISPKIHTRDCQTSKDVYRVNVSFEAFTFKAGDVIAVKNKVIHTTKLGKVVHGNNLLTGKKEALVPKDYEVLKKTKTKVSKVYPEIEVLDPEDYQSVCIKNKKDVKANENVVVVFKNGYYIV